MRRPIAGLLEEAEDDVLEHQPPLVGRNDAGVGGHRGEQRVHRTVADLTPDAIGTRQDTRQDTNLT